jgi:hypothetical protein
MRRRQMMQRQMMQRNQQFQQGNMAGQVGPDGIPYAGMHSSPTTQSVLMILQLKKRLRWSYEGLIETRQPAPAVPVGGDNSGNNYNGGGGNYNNGNNNQGGMGAGRAGALGFGGGLLGGKAASCPTCAVLSRVCRELHPCGRGRDRLKPAVS